MNTLRNPRLNSLALEELRRAFRELAADPSLRTVILGGRGRTFCGGADREELRALTAETAGAFVTRIQLATSVAASIERFARIHTTIPSGLGARKD